MEPRQIKQIQDNHQEIVKKMLKVEEVCDFLITSHALTSSMVEDILANTTTSKQARELNFLMPKRGRDAYDKYYAALFESGNEHLAELLEPYVSPAVGRTQDAPGEERIGGAAPALGNNEQPPQVQLAIPVVEELPREWPDSNFAPQAPIVQQCNLQDPSFQASFQSAMTYSMISVPRGEVLIINNVTFDISAHDGNFLGTRYGSDMDATATRCLFEKLGFSGRVHTKENLDAWDIRTAVGESADRAHKTDSCFICVVLSHGTTGAVYGVDGNLISLTDLTKEVDGKRSPNLVGKPKLFFIQACQGGTKDPGTTTSAGPGGDDPHLNVLFTQMRGGLESTDSERSGEPTKADLFVATASFPGYVSWRNEKTGTWFIQALLYVLSKYSHTCHIDDMMKLVNELVSRNTTLDGKYKQVSRYESTLRKNFYFFPGLPADKW